MLELHYHTETEGQNLLALIAAVRADFLAHDAYYESSNGCRHMNSVRFSTSQVFSKLSKPEQLAVVEDLLFGDSEIEFIRSHQDIFSATDSSTASYIVDLVCEVTWQALMREPDIRIEDEIRAALSNI